MVRVNDPRGALFVDPRAYADMDDWHRRAAELRRDAPVLRVEADGFAPFFALTRHADVLDVSRHHDVWWNTQQSVLGTEESYAQMQAFGADVKTLVHMDGKEHDDYRALTADWFKPASANRMQGRIAELADHFIDRLGDFGGRCDFATDIAMPYTLHVIMSILGVPEEDEPLMLELTQGLFGAEDPEFGADRPDEKVFEVLFRVAAYFNEVVTDRRANPTSDLATVIANGTVDGCPLGDLQMMSYFLIVATAGHDTTSTALSGGLEALLRRPDQLAALRDDPSLATNAVEEIIRWTAPVRHFLRQAQRDAEVRGQTIRQGERVLLSYPAANRDEDVFERAMEFDIARPDASNQLAFGFGVHYCIGSQFARRELRAFLPRLLERVEHLELDGEPEWMPVTFVGGVKHLPIRYRMR
ncbi:MAG: cytochrome P450 [Acidimicrobiia bacterium]